MNVFITLQVKWNVYVNIIKAVHKRNADENGEFHFNCIKTGYEEWHGKKMWR